MPLESPDLNPIAHRAYLGRNGEFENIIPEIITNPLSSTRNRLKVVVIYEGGPVKYLPVLSKRLEIVQMKNLSLYVPTLLRGATIQN